VILQIGTSCWEAEHPRHLCSSAVHPGTVAAALARPLSGAPLLPASSLAPTSHLLLSLRPCLCSSLPSDQLANHCSGVVLSRTSGLPWPGTVLLKPPVSSAITYLPCVVLCFARGDSWCGAPGHLRPTPAGQSSWAPWIRRVPWVELGVAEILVSNPSTAPHRLPSSCSCLCIGVRASGSWKSLWSLMAPPWAVHRRGSGFCRPPPPPGNAVGLGEDLPAVDFTMGDRDLKLVPIGGACV
jgi:hypothetical protein